MKKVIVILLLLTFLGTNTEMLELLRLPIFIHHYLEHSETKHYISFADFLNDHYGDHQSHSDTEHPDHKNLPFKTANCAISDVSIVLKNYIEFTIYCPSSLNTKVSLTYNEVIYSSAIVGNIWQPPKFS